MKKLKLVGNPLKVYKNTAFIQGMFNSEVLFFNNNNSFRWKSINLKVLRSEQSVGYVGKLKRLRNLGNLVLLGKIIIL